MTTWRFHSSFTLFYENLNFVTILELTNSRFYVIFEVPFILFPPQGSSQAVLGACSQVLSVPQLKGDSLSVVAATSICLYELSKLTLIERGTQFDPHWIWMCLFSKTIAPLPSPLWLYCNEIGVRDTQLAHQSLDHSLSTRALWIGIPPFICWARK